MNRSPLLRQTLARGAAAGFVLVDAALVQARAAPVDIRIVSSAPSDTTVDAYAHGRDRLAAGDVTAALSAFRQALAADPQSVGALNGIAVCYDRLGQYDISHTYYMLALSLDPTSPTVLNNYGYSLYLQGDHAAALVPLRTAAASSDADAAKASRRTLALIAAALPTAASAPYPGDDPDGPHIVQMSDGEQRLITRAAPSAAVATLGVDAALTAAAAPWRESDDARLTAEEHRSEIAVALAAAIAAPHPAIVATPDFTSVVLNEAPPAPAAAPLDTALRIDRALPPGLREADDDTTTTHWLAALPGGGSPRAPARRPQAGLAPPAPERAGFDSDDHELNRFAALMKGDEAAVREAAIERLQLLRIRLALA